MSRAALMQQFGPLDTIQVVERDVPEPAEGEVRVRMTVAGFHPLEALIASGAMVPYSKEAPIVLGAVGAGRVETDGATFHAGDRVAVVGNAMGMVRDGIWADHAAVPESLLLKLPDNVDDATAATLGIAPPTAVIALQLATIPAGGTALVLGASGAVGSAAVQLAKIAGLRVVAVSRSAGGCAFAAGLGADDTIDLSATTIPDAAKTLTKGGFDGTIDPIGGQVAAQALKGLKPGSSHVVVGYSAGFETAVFLPDLVNTSCRLIGGSMMSVGLDGLRAAEEEALAGYASGALRAPVAGTFGLDEISEAAAAAADPGVHGRILLSIE